MRFFWQASLLLYLALPAGGAMGANEEALLRIWEQHTQSPGEHAAAIQACETFAEANANDLLLPVVRGIQSWHLFHEQKNEEAFQLLKPYMAGGNDPILKGAQLVALGWFSRLDRERVIEALQLYYRKEVGYPKTLQDLIAHPKIPATDHPPLTDRFGKPWEYQLVGLRGLPKFADQRYSLKSPTLGNLSEITAALEAPYASGIASVPTQVWPALKPPQVTFQLAEGQGVGAIAAGQQTKDLHLAYIGNRIIVVCNHSFWKVFPRP